MPGLTSRIPINPRVLVTNAPAATIAKSLRIADLIVHSAQADPELLTIASELLQTVRAFLELAATRGVVDHNA